MRRVRFRKAKAGFGFGVPVAFAAALIAGGIASPGHAANVSAGQRQDATPPSRCREYPAAGTWANNAYGTKHWCQRPTRWDWETPLDDTGGVIRVKWSGWGSEVARGRGLFIWGRMGHYGRAWAIIRLSGRVENCYIDGSHYTRMKVTVESKRWRPRVVTRVLFGPFCDVG